MIKALLAALLLVSPAFAQEGGALLSGSLIEALNAIEKPELSGVFTYVGETNTPRAFADLIARDAKSMKRYTDKLRKDIKAASGATAWDHQVCATLVTHYSGPEIAGLKRPDAKRMKLLNEVVLAPVLELHEIVARRNK